MMHYIKVNLVMSIRPTRVKILDSLHTVVVLVGDPSVGKTNLLAYFLSSDEKIQHLTKDGAAASFNAGAKPTIGVEFGTKIIQHPNGAKIKVQIWDTGT